MWFLVALSGFMLLAGCTAQRPVLYPNEKLRQVGSAAADREIDECMRRAETYVSSSGRTSQVLQDTAVDAGSSAAIGAAAGAASGAIVGPAGTWAAAGAAGGAAAGTARGLIHGLMRKENPSSVYRNFVNRCLYDKGYDPIGWN